MNVIRILTVVLLAQMVASAQSSTASVQGSVVKAGTNDPLPNATVELRSIDAGPARIYTSTTASDGGFAFRNVPPGRYQLTPIRAGYVRGDYGVRGPGASGVAMTLASGQRMADVRLAMSGTGTIAGRIIDLRGEPVGNVHVKALRFSYHDGHAALTSVKSVFTNDLGEYRLGWLPPGQYNVSALHPDAQANPLNLPENINSATIVGTAVTNAGGMNGGSFSATDDRDPAVRSRMGLASGEDHLPVYYPGTFDHRIASAIDVRAGSEMTGYDIAIGAARPASITGYVTPWPASDAGPGRMSIQVSRDPSYTYRTVPAPVDPETGSFAIAGLAPGSYILTAAAGNGDERVSGRTRIDVAEGTTAVAQVRLERGVRIPVKVVVDGSPSSARVSSLRVSLRTDPVVPGLAETPVATPSDDGSLILPAVVAGDYIVNVAPLMTLSRATATNPPPAVPGPNYAPTGSAVLDRAQMIQTGPDAFARPPLPAPGASAAYVKAIRVDNQDVLNGRLRVDGGTFERLLEIVIGTNPGQIDGVAVDVTKRPAPYITVVLMPETGKRHRSDLYRTVSADASGRFRFQNVPPGEYKVFAWDDVETGAWLNPRFMQLHEDRGQPLSLGEGATITAEVSVIPLR
jgi:hypothetical protein